MAASSPDCGFLVWCRVVRAELGNPGAPSSWPDVIPQHPKDLLQSAVALQGDELVIRCCSWWSWEGVVRTQQASFASLCAVNRVCDAGLCYQPEGMH